MARRRLQNAGGRIFSEFEDDDADTPAQTTQATSEYELTIGIDADADGTIDGGKLKVTESKAVLEHGAASVEVSGGVVTITPSITELQVITQSLMNGEEGFVLSNFRGVSYSVAFSDTNGLVRSTFYVQNGGEFKIRIVHLGTGANIGKSASGKLYVAIDQDGDTMNWTVNAENFDLTLANADIIKTQDNGTAFTIPNNANVGVMWQKDDNAGGAAGSMHVYQLILIRQ